jgi:hypothetical protein
MPFFLLMLAVNRGKNCYCCSFSGDYCYCESKAINEIMALVLQIMPRLQELCGERSPSMSMLHLQEDPLETSTVASTPPSLEPSYHGDKIMPKLQELCGESSMAPMVELGSLGSVVAVMTPSHLSSEPPDTGGVLVSNSEALFEKELHDLLVSLEAASSGYGKDIACVLAGKASECLIRKVEKSLRSRRKKRWITVKLPQLLESG